VANTALNIALVPAWGARGAAVAASASGVVAVVVALRAFTAESHARLSDLRPRRADIEAYVELASSLLGRDRDRT
jgi:O-antigen/teichoic acid export membrane protein